MDKPEGQGATEPERLALPLEWVDAGGVRIEHVDQFALQRGSEDGTFVLVLGQVDLPLVLGDIETQQERMRALPYVGVRIIGRYSLTPRRLEELMRLLERHVARPQSATTEQEP